MSLRILRVVPVTRDYCVRGVWVGHAINQLRVTIHLVSGSGLQEPDGFCIPLATLRQYNNSCECLPLALITLAAVRRKGAIVP